MLIPSYSSASIPLGSLSFRSFYIEYPNITTGRHRCVAILNFILLYLLPAAAAVAAAGEEEEAHSRQNECVQQQQQHSDDRSNLSLSLLSLKIAAADTSLYYNTIYVKPQL